MDTGRSDRPTPPELVAPAGNWDCAKAAVANGADAIYFGLDCGFNARFKAASFPLDELADLLAFLHGHRVRGYVTLNTLVFTDELETLETVVRRIAKAGADAVLVQDIGLARLIRRTVPDLPLHASTQMTLTSAECIAVAEQLGIHRVVLPRELSIGEIARIHQQTRVSLEAFVHGALCVAYSGQCLTSESLGGRSANRGHCAQACRLPYELVCDGRHVDLGDKKYLLSPQDLAAYALVPELIQAGVVSLKIEGRLKTAEYVANITRHYRQAINSATTGTAIAFTERQVEEMELSFSRGFSVGWLQGCDHKALVPATSSAKRGILVGRVRGTQGDRVLVALCGRLKAGDGVVFQGDRAAGGEQGGRVFTVSQRRQRVEGEVSDGVVALSFAQGTVDLNRLWSGQELWKNDDPALTRSLRKSFTGDLRGSDLPVEIEALAAVGHPLRLVVRAEGLPVFRLAGAEPLEAAIRHPLTREVLQKQLGRLGGSGFTLAKLTATIDGVPMVPLSVLGSLRREMVAGLQAARHRAASVGWATADEPVLPQLRGEIRCIADSSASPELTILCRSMHQLRAVLDLRAASVVYVDFQEIREYRDAVALAEGEGARIFLATPRIQKPGEAGVFRALLRHEPYGILARNLAALDFFTRAAVPVVADYSLNAANELSSEYLRQGGALRVTPSYDLNRDQLLGMVRRTPPAMLEIVIHQNMPMFHMEHCVFCAVLSPGRNKTNCGRPCDRHEVRLRDRIGVEHPLKADVGCRNTLFNAVAQSGAEIVAPLLQLGVRYFRVELLADDTSAQLHRTVSLYRDLIRGKVTGREVWTALQAVNRIGVTRGTLEAL